MTKLIKDNDIILDGEKTREQKTKEALKKLGDIETLLDHYNIESLLELKLVLYHYWYMTEIKNHCNISKEIERLCNSKN